MIIIYTQVPTIVLKGKWLEEAGFKSVDYVEAEIDGEKITDVKYTVAKDALTGDGVVLKKGKKKFNKVLAK